VQEIEGLSDILEQGTSAHNQQKVYQASLAAGASSEQALRDVVDWLIQQTVKDI
jgi:glutamate---cysteine ligase / carboxylate-amine ligase